MTLVEMMVMQGDMRTYSDNMEYRLESCGLVVYSGRSDGMFDDEGNYRSEIEALLDREIVDVRAECGSARSGSQTPVLVIALEG